MNFALLNFVLQAGRDSCALVCIAASKILVLVQNCVGLPADTGSKKKPPCFVSFPGTLHASAVC